MKIGLRPFLVLVLRFLIWCDWQILTRYAIICFMAKQRMIVTDDQLLIDMDLLFNAIREADGDWETVESEMQQYLRAVQSMVED